MTGINTGDTNPESLNYDPSVLDVVEGHLLNNQNVAIVGDVIRDYSGFESFIESVSIFVAPKNPMLDNDGAELNEFMHSLLPEGLELIFHETEGWNNKKNLTVPMISLVEIVGQRKTITVVEVTSSLHPSEMARFRTKPTKLGRWKKPDRVEDAERHMLVRVYPCQALAEMARNKFEEERRTNQMYMSGESRSPIGRYITPKQMKEMRNPDRSEKPKTRSRYASWHH